MQSEIVKMARRDFLKLAAILGVGVTLKLYRADIVEALVVKRAHVFWMYGTNCTGCTYSFLSAIPEVEVVLTQTLGNTQSDGPVFLPYWLSAVNPLWGADYGLEPGIKAWEEAPSPRVLVVEGGIATEFRGKTCVIGTYTSMELIKKLAPKADIILAIGSCASFGGMPSASPNPTKIKDAKEFLQDEGLTADAAKVIRLPRCPAHPESVALTVAAAVTGERIDVDSYGRPLVFYEGYDGAPEPRTVHHHCPRVHYYHRGIFAEKPGDPYCMFKLGCKGPYTNADCSIRKWNRGTSMCTQIGTPCLGCAQPDWPDAQMPYWVRVEAVPVYFTLTPIQWVQTAAIVTGIGIAAHAARKVVTRTRKEAG